MISILRPKNNGRCKYQRDVLVSQAAVKGYRTPVPYTRLRTAVMAYDRHQIFERVDTLLSRTPRLSLSKISHELNVERHTVEKLVRMETGKSFRQFRQEKLFAAASNLLDSEPAKSIKEISFLLGYASPSAFARFVRAFCGRSPMQVRRESNGSSSRAIL